MKSSSLKQSLGVFPYCLLPTFLFFTTVGQAQQSLFIDNFSTAGTVELAWTPSISVGNMVNIEDLNAGSSVFGGTRNMTLSNCMGAPSGPLGVRINILTNPGNFNVSSDVGRVCDATVLYDAGGAGLDLDARNFTSLNLAFSSSDQPTQVNILLSDGNNNATLSQNIMPIDPNNEPPQILQFNLSDFIAQNNQLDLGNLQSIEFNLVALDDFLDIRLDAISLFNPTPPTTSPPVDLPTIPNKGLGLFALLIGLITISFMDHVRLK